MIHPAQKADGGVCSGRQYREQPSSAEETPHQQYRFASPGLKVDLMAGNGRNPASDCGVGDFTFLSRAFDLSLHKELLTSVY